MLLLHCDTRKMSRKSDVREKKRSCGSSFLRPILFHPRDDPPGSTVFPANNPIGILIEVEVVQGFAHPAMPEIPAQIWKHLVIRKPFLEPCIHPVNNKAVAEAMYSWFFIACGCIRCPCPGVIEVIVQGCLVDMPFGIARGKKPKRYLP